MTSSLTLRWLLTVSFAVLGGYCLLRCAVPALTRPAHTVADWASDLAHLAMSAGMIAMLWALTRADRWGIQPAVFAVAATWYLVRAVDSRHARRYRVGLVHQGVAMAAMLWMFLAMNGTGPGSTGMPGMAMGGMTMAGTARHVALLSTPHAVTIAFAAYLALATIWWLRSAFSTSATIAGGVAAVLPAGHGSAIGHAGVRVVFGPAGEAGCQMLMAAAMCVALLVSI